MLVKALKSFTTADLKLSLGVGHVADIANDLAAQLVEEGLVEAYEEIHPAGAIDITQNGDVDVTRFKTAKVRCGQWTVTFDGNNVQQEKVNIVVVKGDSCYLLGQDSFTVPEGTHLSGWATTADADAPDIDDEPYTPAKDATLFAVWEAIEGDINE